MASHKWWQTLIPIYGIYPILDSIFGNGDFGGSSSIDSIIGKYTGSHATGADREAWSEQESLQEDAQQHDIDMANYNHQLSLDYFNQVQSPAAKVAQYQEAGLNPALMMSSGVGSTSPASFASSASGQGSAGAPSRGDIGNLISGLAGIALRAQEVKADTALKSAEASERRNNADLIKLQIDNFHNEWKLKQDEFQLQKQIANKNFEDIDSKIALRVSERALNRANISGVYAENSLRTWQAINSQIDASWKGVLNQSLLDLQEVSRNKSNAEIKLTYAKTDSERQKYKEQVQSWNERFNQICAKTISDMAEAGIKSYDLEYWKDFKHLEAVSIQAKAVSDLKLRLPFGFDYRPANVMNGLGLRANDGSPIISLSPFASGVPMNANSDGSISSINHLDPWTWHDPALTGRERSENFRLWWQYNMNHSFGDYRNDKKYHHPRK